MPTTTDVEPRSPHAELPSRDRLFSCPMHPEIQESTSGDCPKCGMALESVGLPRAAAKIEWTCPMHPHVLRESPTDCPECGMALEATSVPTPFGQTGPSQVDDNPELRDMRRRFWFAAALSIPLVSMVMLDMLPHQPISTWLPGRSFAFIQLVLATPVCLWSAWPFYLKAYRSLQHRSLNMFTLIGIGVSVAFLYSLLAALAPGLFPESFRSHGGEVALYFEAATMIVTLILLGQVLELRARSQTNTAIQKLLGLAAMQARLVQKNGSEIDIPLEQVRPGDHLRIRPGEKVPVDGIVFEGHSNIDESMVTGEAIPVPKSEGNSLIGGTINGNGSLLMRAEKVGSETLLARIVSMVAEAQRSRAPIQNLADLVSGYFVPAVLLAAFITFIVWAAFGPEPAMTYALINAVAVLIIACPCALGLATPMSIMVATGKAASYGLLFRNAEAIETMDKIDTLLVDKTGTLTEGRPRLVTVSVPPQPDFDPPLDETTVLRYAASLEQASEHPLAAAIVQGAQDRKIALSKLDQFESVAGKGVQGIIEGHRIVLGNLAMIHDMERENAAEISATQESFLQSAESLRKKGQTVMFLAMDGRVAGLLGVADPIKDSTPKAIAELRREGVRIVMLTGDSQSTAEAVARQLNLNLNKDEVIAGVLPQEKATAVKRFQDKGQIVAMAGDGINDAPALAQAHVGIAMGTGTDVAMESAGLTLVKGDLRGILRARMLSHRTMSNIRQNLFFAFAYNALGVPIAAGVLYPIFGILLSPMLAAAAMSFSSVSVISNALRLRNIEL